MYFSFSCATESCTCQSLLTVPPKLHRAACAPLPRETTVAVRKKHLPQCQMTRKCVRLLLSTTFHFV